MSKAQLQALKMQLHPHFPFQCLELHRRSANGKSEGRTGNDRTARRFSADDSGKCRRAGSVAGKRDRDAQMLSGHRKDTARQTAFVTNIEISPPMSSINCQIPNLLLQPLVENAIRHGIAPQTDGGKDRHQGGA